MSTDTLIGTSTVIAVLSMLHEPTAGPNSATRRFRGEAPLAWTLFRLSQSAKIGQLAVLCWKEQLESVSPVAGEMKARCFAFSSRIAVEKLDATSASRRWADGWRGGLLSACEFDRGFHGQWMLRILNELDGESALIVDPAAGLIDPALTDQLIEHAAQHPDVDFCFTQAAPGICGALLRKPMLEQLAGTGSSPGVLLGYRPDLPQRDPIASPACMPVAAALARTTFRFSLDSQRQIDFISRGTFHLNGQLRSTEAEQLVQDLSAARSDYLLPREIVLELTARRNTNPAFLPSGHLKFERPDIDLSIAKAVIDELATVDDARLMLGGVGDPLLHKNTFELIEHARAAGVAVAMETDLVGVDDATLDKLADASLDVISIHLSAARPETYQALMGVDALLNVLENIKRLVLRRQSRRAGTPLIVPTFVKTAANLGEMESWYDHWMRVLGCAVIDGPGDFAKKIPDLSLVRMTPPIRKACSRLAQRITVLCDGSIVACEQDVMGLNVLGRIGINSIQSVWRGKAAALRVDHAARQWMKHPTCAACSEWHRP